MPAVTLFFLYLLIHSVTSFLCGSTSPMHNDKDYTSLKLHKAAI